MSDARAPLADLMQRAVEAHAAIYRAAGCAVTVGAGHCVIDHGPRLAAGRAIGGERPPLEVIWRHGQECSWRRVSLRHYPHFTHVIAEQSIDGEVVASTAIVPARALPALSTALRGRSDDYRTGQPARPEGAS
ncbi:MAG: hypothetical protein Q7J32_05200 [Sphingomonadaceae bacterium]|nr:hypothetical protein [Sphingomonadaceae bacterium]